METAANGTTESSTACMQAEAPDGYVSIAYAEAKWLEREAEVQRIIQEAVAHAIAPGSAAPSETQGDVADLSSLDESLLKDDKWGKRKAVLTKERDIMATKIRGSLAKVSSSSSPFNKKVARTPVA